MFRNYITVAIRNLLRHPGYSLINIVGLSVGMSCALLIITYIKYEFSYDAHHENLDRIYRVIRQKSPGREAEAPSRPRPVVWRKNCGRPFRPLRQRHGCGSNGFGFGTKTGGSSESSAWSTRAFFDIFTVPILEGDLSSLQTPHTALISTRTAELLFPEADPNRPDHHGRPSLLQGRLPRHRRLRAPARNVVRRLRLPDVNQAGCATGMVGRVAKLHG